LVVRQAALCIANCDNTADRIASYGVPEARIRVVRPGVDCDRFHPAVDGSALRASLAGPDDVLLVAVGRLQRRKGHDHTIRALALLREQGLMHIRLAISGIGEMEGELRSMAAQLGVADAVTFLGRIAQGDLPALYAAADVFAMPNRDVGADFEGFGIVFLEAQATALPVIAGRSGGAPEAVVEDRTALLVDGSRPEAIAGAIRRLAADPELRARMGAAGRRHVLEHCRWSVAAQKLRAIHEEVSGR
jgi:phosphatidylinositol alpha-1,6-mannosyltransferase